MAAKKAPVKGRKSKLKKKSGKEKRVFLAFFLFIVLIMVLYVVTQVINQKMIESKTVQVNADLELGGGQPVNFKEPMALATDANSDIYVSDFSGQVVEKFDPNGALLMTLGKEGKNPGDFEQPSGLDVTADGKIYVCDTFNHRIEVFDPQGQLLKVWTHSFFGPRDIADNGQGRFFVSDTGNHQIQVFDQDGNFLMQWGGFGTAEGKFREPVGITVDPAGSVYVADSDNKRVQKFDFNGKFLSAFKVATWHGKNAEEPYLAFKGGYLYASNASQKTVLKYDPSGKLIAIFHKKDGGFDGAAGVAVDTAGRVIVAERGGGKVSRFEMPSNPQ